MLCLSRAAQLRRATRGASIKPSQSTATHQSYALLGTYSRMLDMGGAPSAQNDSTPFRLNNASKNSKLQVVAFDFELLTNSFEDTSVSETTGTGRDSSSQPKLVTSSTVEANTSMVQQVAALLNIEMGSSPVKQKETISIDGAAKPKTTDVPKPSNPHEDIRAKYASKLKGGLAGIEFAKSQVEETLMRGDAGGHLAAREMAVKSAAKSHTPKWMAMSGTGKLLGYLSNRSIQIALLPNPQSTEKNPRMHDLSRQLSDIVIDVVVDPSADGTATSCITQLQGSLSDETEMKKVMVVSDRDDYLRAARECGMITCHVRKPNARRSGITTNFNVKSVPEVQEIVNEIAGISFNAVINR